MITRIVHLPDDVHEKAKQYCMEREMTLTAWVSRLVHEAVDGQSSPQEPIEDRTDDDISAQS